MALDESQKEEKLNKLIKKVDENWIDGVRSGKDEELRALMIQLSKEMEDNIEDKKANVELNTAKLKVKDLNGGFNDLIKDKKNKLSIIMLILEARGRL